MAAVSPPKGKGSVGECRASGPVLTAAVTYGASVRARALPTGHGRCTHPAQGEKGRRGIRRA
eukprot:5583149-Pleurochrysis_carterae.AAC.2